MGMTKREFKKMSIDKLYHPEKNARTHSDYQKQELYKSVQKFSQIRPVVIDEEGMIITGNGLVMAMRDHGETEVEVLQLSGLSKDQKYKLMIADNRIYSLGQDSNAKIMEILQELDDFDVPGYDENLLKDLFLDNGSEELIEKTATNFGVLTEEQRQSIQASQDRIGETNTDVYNNREQYKASSITTEQLADEEKRMFGTNNIEREMAEKKTIVVCPHCNEEFYI